MENAYIEERADTYYVRGLRVQLSQIILQWREGALPETIALNFAALTPAQVYGAIAFYLDHRAELDAHFIELWRAEEAIVKEHYANDAQRYSAMQARFAAVKAHETLLAS